MANAESPTARATVLRSCRKVVVRRTVVSGRAWGWDIGLDLLAAHRPSLIRRVPCTSGRSREQLYSLALTSPEYAARGLVPAGGHRRHGDAWPRAQGGKHEARVHEKRRSSARARCVTTSHRPVERSTSRS